MKRQRNVHSSGGIADCRHGLLRDVDETNADPDVAVASTESPARSTLTVHLQLLLDAICDSAHVGSNLLLGLADHSHNRTHDVLVGLGSVGGKHTKKGA